MEFVVERRRRKTLCIKVLQDGTVQVSAPWYTPSRIIEDAVNKRLKWINARKAYLASHPAPVYDKTSADWKALKAKASARFAALAAVWEARFKTEYGVAPTCWSVRDMHTRWGSCSSRTGRISLSVALYYKSDLCVEYVIVHELCHLIHPNHGADFYRLLARECPQWKECKKMLNVL